MGMITRCPHCGHNIEMVPDTQGRTIVVDAEVRQVALDYPSGYVRVKEARLLHVCQNTGELGHVVR